MNSAALMHLAVSLAQKQPLLSSLNASEGSTKQGKTVGIGFALCGPRSKLRKILSRK